MKTRIILLLNLVFLVCGADLASAFYDPTVGRWLNRDPIEESGGVNLATAFANNPVGFFDAFGLEEEGFEEIQITDPDTGDTVTLESPQITRSTSEHRNYLTYTISCPDGEKVDNVKADYSKVRLSGLQLPQGGGGMGGIRSVTGINCEGNNVTVTAFMRTRNVSPRNPWGEANAKSYQRNTRITYDCAKCEDCE